MRVLFFLLLLPSVVCCQTLTSYSKDTLLMGSAFNFTAVHSDYQQAKDAVYLAIAEVNRIENLISSWKSSSETSMINAAAGKHPVKVSPELFNLIARSIKISELSNGFFDISFAAIDKLWVFNGEEQVLPDSAQVASSVRKINYKNILLNKEKYEVFLKEEGMKIGFGAIGKGYAADRAKELMLSLGVESGVVNAAGDLLAWGRKPDEQLWTIGLADPNHKNEILSTIDIDNSAIVTSGDYERFLLIEGKRFGHIINPKTGYPVHGVLSVTVITASAEVADALATTIFVLGIVDGLALANHLKGVECIIIADNNKFFYSDGIQLNLQHNE